jgi:hypothetical protein
MLDDPDHPPTESEAQTVPQHCLHQSAFNGKSGSATAQSRTVADLRHFSVDPDPNLDPRIHASD